MTIADATPDDLPAIAAIWNRLIRESTATFTTEEKTVPGLAAWAEGRRAAGLPLLVVRGPDVLGFATAGPFRPGPGYAGTLEHTIVLAPAATGRGLGSRLLAALEARLTVRSLIAGMCHENATAIAFHAARGFDRVAHIPGAGRKFGRPLDLILMQKRFDLGRTPG